MALRHRAAQIQAPENTAIPSQIAAPLSDDGSRSNNDAKTTAIVAESQALVISATVTQPASTVVLTPTPTATITPSSTPAPAPAGLGTGAIVGIAIGVAAILLIPAAYLIWRAHQIKREDEWRMSQRSSQEAMIMKESVETKRDNGPPPPRPRRSPSDAPRERPTNSLGLFNFDLASPAPAPSSPPQPQSPERPKPAPRLSIARTLQLKRPEVNVVTQERRSQQRISELRNGLRSNPSTDRNLPKESRDAPPPPYTGSPTSPDSKFAPLNSIGTAVSAGRPKFSRNPSTSTIPLQSTPPPQQAMPHPATAVETRQSPPPPPGTQDMRQGSTLHAPFSDHTANAHISAYSVSDYHDSLQPPPRIQQPSSSSSPSSQAQPPPTHDIGRAVSPIPRALSPINNYQLPTLGLGSDDRFSWGGVAGAPSRSPSQRQKTEEAQPFNFGTAVHNHGNNSSRSPPTTNHHDERRSDVSGLSYDPVYDNRKSNGRAISPVESVEDLGLRTREYP